MFLRVACDIGFRVPLMRQLLKLPGKPAWGNAEIREWRSTNVEWRKNAQSSKQQNSSFPASSSIRYSDHSQMKSSVRSSMSIAIASTMRKLQRSGMFYHPELILAAWKYNVDRTELDAAPEIQHILPETIFDDDAALDCEYSWLRGSDANAKRKTRRILPATKIRIRSTSCR